MAVDVSGLQAAIINAAVPICGIAADLRESDIAAAAPIDTGALSQSGEVSVQGDGDGAVATIRFTEPYASFLDEGTGPHTIEGNPYLAFNWNGVDVVVRSVQHPGSTKHVGWFKDRALDETLWGLACQSAVDGYVIQ